MGNKGSTNNRRHTMAAEKDKDSVKNPLSRHSQTLRNISQSEPRKGAPSFAQRLSKASAFLGSTTQKNYYDDNDFDGGDGDGDNEELVRSSYQLAGDILEGLDNSYIIPFRHLELETPPIAAGGGGQIYRAEMHGAVVAVKALYSQLMTGDVNDLKHEVGMIARARCPNIISFYGVSHHCGVTYIVTEFCPLSLADVVGRSQFDGKAFSQVATQILQALVYLHSNNIAHRDIKPPNVLLLADGCVKLCDLGMSKFVDQKKISMTGGIVGSPTYMPPEAFESLKQTSSNNDTAVDNDNSHSSNKSKSSEGNDIDGVRKMKEKKLDKAVKVDGKAWDIYSLGVLLWWMWHFQDPYKGSSTNIFQIAEIVKNKGRPCWFKKKVSNNNENESNAVSDDGEASKDDCFVEAPIELRAFVEELWAQDSFERPSAALSLQQFKKHVSPVLLKVGSLRPQVNEADDIGSSNEIQQPDLDVDYDRYYIDLNDIGNIQNNNNNNGKVNNDKNDGENKKKKNKKVGVKFKFDDEDVIISEDNQNNDSSNPSSPSSSNPISPSSGRPSTLVPQSSLLTPSSLTMSKLLPQVPSPAQQKIELQRSTLKPPSLFQPPKPPSASSSSSSSDTTSSSSFSSQVMKLDMISKPDEKLKTSLERMMTPGKTGGIELQRSRLLLELVAASRDRGASVVFTDSEEANRQSSVYRRSDIRSISTNSTNSLSNSISGSNSPQSPASPLNYSRKRPSALNSIGERNLPTQRNRNGSTGQFSTMLQRQESLRLQEARSLKGRQMRTDSEAIMYVSGGGGIPPSPMNKSKENSFEEMRLTDVIDETIQESPEKPSPTASPQQNAAKTALSSSSSSTSSSSTSSSSTSSTTALETSAAEGSKTSSTPEKEVKDSSSSSSNRLVLKDDGRSNEERRIRNWIISIVGDELLSREGDLLMDLKDGVVICELLNTLLKRRLESDNSSDKRRLSDTESSLYTKAMIKTIHTSPLGFKQMENIGTFIKSCRSLQLSRQSVGGGNSADILFDIGHLRSNLPNGLARVMTTLKALRNTLDDDYKDDEVMMEATQSQTKDEDKEEDKKGEGGGNIDETEDDEVVHVSNVFSGGSAEKGGVRRGSQFAMTSPLSSDIGKPSVFPDNPMNRSSSQPTEKATTTVPTQTHNRSSSSLPPPPPPTVPSPPNTAEIERRRLMDKFKNKAMTSSSSSKLSASSPTPITETNSGDTMKGISSPAVLAQNRKSAGSQSSKEDGEQGMFKKGSVKIIFRQNE